MDGSGSMKTKDDGNKSRWDHLVEQMINFIDIRSTDVGDLISIIEYSKGIKIHAKS